MKKLVLGILALIIVVGGLSLALKDDSDDMSDMNMQSNSSMNTDSSNESAEPNMVTMKNIDYTVKALTVKKGTTVTWRNDDTAKHDVSFDDSNMAMASSKLLDKGESHQFKFDQVGEFSYHCTPHPFMKAKIVVTE